eukprot:scaffold2030_cov131-Amphora_coffeaeformis.AAC.2
MIALRSLSFLLVIIMGGVTSVDAFTTRVGSRTVTATTTTSSSTTTTTTTTAGFPKQAAPSAAASSMIATTAIPFRRRTPHLLRVSLSTLEEQQQQHQQQQQSSAPPEQASSSSTTGGFPELGEDGIYRINNKEEHQAFLQENKDKLVIFKVFAPWCRACKGLEPKFIQIAHEEQYAGMPLVFAQLSIQHNKDFVKSLGVLALPTVQFYVGGALHDNFPCGPSKVPILKRKLTQLVADHIDTESKQVKESSIEYYQNQLTSASDVENSSTRSTAQLAAPLNTTEAIGASAITETAQPLQPTMAERNRIMQTIPYFQEMSLADADAVLDKARLLTFEPKSVIMREGKPGRTFYILREGEVEICQATAYPYDPLVVPSSYLGTVINRLQPGEYFGERSLLTGEPRAASLRTTDRPVTCWALDRDDFPESSPLSGRTRGTSSEARLEGVNDKYGVNFFDNIYDQEATNQLKDAQTASQIRGSINTPQLIRGVDTDEDVDLDYSYGDQVEEYEMAKTGIVSPDGVKMAVGGDAIFGVLRRFQLIRAVSQCFDYIVETKATWGTTGIRKRREYLVKRLSPTQRADFRETFHLIDASGDGYISLLELQRVMESIGSPKTDAELQGVMENASLDGRPEMNLQDFEGLMAEAEFYNLFRDIFSTLDTQNSGFVKAGELDRVLAGVRDLISDDQKSLIDVEDPDVLIDYERFSRMLLGTALI